MKRLHPDVRVHINLAVQGQLTNTVFDDIFIMLFRKEVKLNMK